MTLSSVKPMRFPSLESVERLCLPALEAAIDRFFEHASREGFAWNAEMSRYHFSTGGKRLRALIPCWLFSLFGADPLRAIPLGAALEFVHNATLVHDDLQDGDTVRRGKPTVWKRYSEPQAINCGDALFHFVWEILAKLEVTPIQWKALVQELSRGTLRVIEGQAQEFLMKEEPSPGWERYLGVVQGKTAALIATATASALIALQIPEATLGHAREGATRSGTLFQLQDDLLDVYGDKQRERTASDIAEGKISALVALFNEVASPEDKQIVSRVLRLPREAVGAEQISAVLSLFERYSVKDLLIEKIRALQEENRRVAPPDRADEISHFFQELDTRFLRPVNFLV